MRHFRLKLILQILSVTAFSILAGVLFCQDKTAPGIAALLGSAIAWVMLLVTIRKPINLISSFTSALENNDRTMRFDSESDDRDLREISGAMNRIISIYRGSRMELETRKLYYDRILRIMTHEMRNSITPIIALAEDFSGNPEKYDKEMYAESMGIIGKQSVSIRKFLDSYYSLTHLPQPDKQPVSASEFLCRIKVLTELEEQNRCFPVSVCRFSAPVDFYVDIDADLLTQALMNVIRNSLDAVSGKESPKIDVSFSVSEGIPFVTVTDNGPGLPESVKSNLFQPFFTTKKDGSGIGLSLSRQICRMHGGDLSIVSNPCRGTAVTIRLK